MSNACLDANRQATFMVNGYPLIATLGMDFDWTLYNTKTGKELKNFPRCDAANEFRALRDDIKEQVAREKSVLWEAFIEKHEIQDWENCYTKNAVLNIFAQTLVWNSAGVNFVLSNAGYVNEKGETVTIDTAVTLAHPMEMNAEQLQAWKSYFMGKGFKQPIEQLEIEVSAKIDAGKDAYKGESLDRACLKALEKVGFEIVYEREAEDDFCIYFDPDGHEIESDVPPMKGISLRYKGIEVTGTYFKPYYEQDRAMLLFYYDELSHVAPWVIDEIKIPDAACRRKINYVYAELEKSIEDFKDYMKREGSQTNGHWSRH